MSLNMWLIFDRICVNSLSFCLQPGQIIDFRAMLNDATKMNSEEGADGSVSYILDLEDFIFIINQVNQKDNKFVLGTGKGSPFLVKRMWLKFSHQFLHVIPNIAIL